MHETDALPLDLHVSASGQSERDLARQVSNGASEVILPLVSSLHFQTTTEGHVGAQIVPVVGLHHAEESLSILLVHLQRIRKVTMRTVLTLITQGNEELTTGGHKEHAVKTPLLAIRRRSGRS